MTSLKERQKNKIAYGLWLPQSEIARLNHPSLRDLTLSWLRFGYQGKVIESTSINAVLDRALEQGHSACFIQVAGNIISEDWMLPHWQEADFHQCVQKHLTNNDFLISANFTEADGYFSLDTSCFFVDLLHYQALGLPRFGDGFNASDKHDVQLIKPQVMTASIEGKDQDLLKASNERVFVTSAGCGWGFIDASLRHELTVPQLPPYIANKRFLLESIPQSMPREKSNLVQRTPSSEPIQKRFLEGIDTQINYGRNGVFLWNIESYDDLPEHHSGSMAKISNLYCVAAGFKPNMLLHRQGFHTDTCVTFFDYSQQALNVRKTLLDEWDGTDYPSFCRILMQRYPEPETFYQLWNGIKASEIDWNDVDQLWDSELNKWGGEDEFKQMWQAQQSLKFEFVQGDFINNPTLLLDRIGDSEGATLWWSNAFFTISSNWLMTIEQRKKCFHRWIDSLAIRAPECRIYGADHNNAPINNISAAEYVDVLATHIGNKKYELTPLQSARPLRF